MEPKKRKIDTLLSSVLLLIIASALVTLPLASAHDPAWNIPTYAYITAAPKTIGVGETASIMFWLNWPPPTAAGAGGDRWTFILEVEKPDGTKQNLGTFTSDSVGGGWTQYTPDQTGTYIFTVTFPGQKASLSGPTGLPGSNSAYVNDTFLSSSATATLTVQAEKISQPESYPLPTRYWTRPIEGQNTNWYTIASNWLGSPQIIGRVQSDGLSPDTPHIMWTKPLSFGGVVGGSNTGIPGMTYYSGTAYEGKMGSALIIQGRLYYGLPRSNSPSGGGYACVDLHTGEQIYWQNMTLPSFAQLYDYESMNQHGVIPNGYLWRSVNDPQNGGTVWMAYDSIDGNWLFNETNVPSGTQVYGPNGEILIYQLGTGGNWLALWNNTAAHDLTNSRDPNDWTSSNYYQWRPVGKNVNASNAYSWNVSIPALGTGATIVKVYYGDVLLGRTGALPSVGSSWSDYTVWALNLNASKGEIGNLLWSKSFTAPSGNLTVSMGQADPLTRVFTLYYKETMQWIGFSLDTGDKLWGPTPSEDPWNFFALTTGYFGAGASAVAYGKLYTTGYSGIVYCYDMKTGTLLWNYSASGGFATPYGNYPLLIGAVADGKIYAYSYEHSANAPHWTGSKFRCIDAYNGEELWAIAGWGADGSVAIADGYLVYLNLYDMQIYCFGRGESKTTITASPKVSTKGSSILIEGSVIDQTPAAKGTAAMSDISMAKWMEYLYMQKPLPSDATGVTVKLTATDSSGKKIDIGIVTTDIDGQYSTLWKPADEGKYIITAEFEGNKAYWPSYAKTAIGIDAAPAVTQPQITSPPAPTTTQPLTTPTPAATTSASISPSPSPAVNPKQGSNTETYIIVAAVIIIIAIVIAAIVLRRNK